MIKIPNNGKYSQPNNSDLFGNISKSKSLNFDEDGYLKSSPRTVSLINSATDTDFNIPVAFGRHSQGAFYIATTENPYILSLNDSLSSLSKDTDSGDDTPPAMNFKTNGKWWRGLWHITTDTALYYKTVSTGDWTNTGIPTLTSGKIHAIEIFEKQGVGSILVSDGNTLRQLASDYSTTNPTGGTFAQLTIASDYEITGVAYNNNYVGIATRLDSLVSAENKEAGFFIWDGSESSANNMYYSGSDYILQVAPYQSSFVILTRTGQLKLFNGGGFTELANLPVYFKDIVWGNLNIQSLGDLIKVDGDLIYININSAIIDKNKNTFDTNMLGGIWCYDPAIGLYHRYSPSISKGQFLYSRVEDINTSTDVISVFSGFSLPTSPTVPATGSPIKIVSSAVGGITANNIYYIIKQSSSTYKLASSLWNAQQGVAIDLTSTGILIGLALEVVDYGQSKVARSGGIGFTGDKQYSYDDIVFGGEYYPINSTNVVSHLNISVQGFKNISYIETSKIMSGDVEDNTQKLFIKYKPLGANDKIKIKYRGKDIYGLPEYASCTVYGKKTLVTTSSIPNAYGTTSDLECEIVSGAGAGQIVKIDSIVYDGTTYSITLDEDIDEISAGNTCDIQINNWTLEKEIDSSKNNQCWDEIAIAKTSKWAMFKVILEGSDISIEELQIINTKHLSSV